MYANSGQKFYNEMKIEMDPIEGTIFDAEYQIWLDKHLLEKAETECERVGSNGRYCYTRKETERSYYK